MKKLIMLGILSVLFSNVRSMSFDQKFLDVFKINSEEKISRNNIYSSAVNLIPKRILSEIRGKLQALDIEQGLEFPEEVLATSLELFEQIVVIVGRVKGYLPKERRETDRPGCGDYIAETFPANKKIIKRLDEFCYELSNFSAFLKLGYSFEQAFEGFSSGDNPQAILACRRLGLDI